MIFIIIHIVRENEKITDILRNYNVTLDDIKVCNLHITDFNNLRPSTKLRIPSINSETVEILDKSEPLVSQYYEPNYQIEENNNDSNNTTDNYSKKRPFNNFGFRGLNFIKPNRQNRGFNKSIYPHFIDKDNNNNSK